MQEDTTFYTQTMAKVYADQGDSAKAAEIYRWLLKREPNNREWAAELAAAKAKTKPDASADLVPLITHWVQLTLRCRHQQRLRKMRRQLQK